MNKYDEQNINFGMMPRDAKIMLIAKLFDDPLYFIEILNNDEYMYKNLVVDNELLWQSLWIKFVSKKLPKTDNLDNLKEQYINAIKLYTQSPKMVVRDKKNKKYDIIYKNSKELMKFMDYEDKKVNYKNIVYLKQLKNYLKYGPQFYLATAIESKDDKRFKYLLDNYVDDINSIRSIILAILIRKNKIKDSKLLIERGMDVQEESLSMPNPLETALFYNNYEIIKSIFKNNKNLILNPKTIYMVIMGNSSLVEYDKLDYNMMLDASIKILKILLDNGADINGIYEGETHLQTALKFKQYDIAKFLIDNGAIQNK